MKKKKIKKKKLGKAVITQNSCPKKKNLIMGKSLGLPIGIFVFAIAIISIVIAIIGSKSVTSTNFVQKQKVIDPGKRLLYLIATLPDESARNNLKSMLEQKGMKISFLRSGIFNFDARNNSMGFNPQIMSMPDGYILSYLVHENRHIEDWQGKHESGKMYAQCELEKYTSRDCIIEWWEAEFRAVEQQAIFLKKYNLAWTMSVSLKLNNREIFEKYDVRMAALIYLRENYYADKSFPPDFLEVFPEFYNKKLAEIN